MPLHLVLLLLVLLLSAAPTQAAFTPQDLRGLYVFRFGDPRCPQTIQITTRTLSVSPSQIALNGTEICTSGTILVQNTPGADAGLFARYLSGTRESGAYIVFTVTQPLICPGRTFPLEQQFVFVKPDQEFQVEWSAVFENSNTQLANRSRDQYVFEKDRAVMIFSDACLYTRRSIPNDNGRACFPACATVHTATGGVVEMSRVQVGELVAVGAGRYERVVGFSHADDRAVSRFVRIVVDGGKKLDLTHGHILRADGRYMRAGEVRVGMAVWVAAGGRVVERKVVRIEEVFGRGLYNLHTEGGDVVVDGVVVSCYTDAVPRFVAHALLAPVRAAVAWAGVDLLGWTGVF